MSGYERNDAEDLGANWVLSEPPAPPNRLIVYTQFGPQELARTCSICTEPWQAGDECISHNGGPFMHKVCEERIRAAQP